MGGDGDVLATSLVGELLWLFYLLYIGLMVF